MRVFFELCPKCKDRFVERVIEDFQEYVAGTCPKCGGKMKFVLSGRKRVNNTTYKIVINKIDYMKKWIDRCVKIIMEIGKIDKKEAVKRMKTKNSVIFEGDLFHTYLNLRLLDKISSLIEYTVIPNFPYGRAMTMMCPDCGGDANCKIVNIGNGLCESGFYCEKCCDWIVYNVFSQFEVDETYFYLEASIEEADVAIKEMILENIENVCDKKIEHEKIILRDNARNLEIILSIMESYNITYRIEPSYPYKIPKWNSDYYGGKTED